MSILTTSFLHRWRAARLPSPAFLLAAGLHAAALLAMLVVGQTVPAPQPQIMYVTLSTPAPVPAAPRQPPPTPQAPKPSQAKPAATKPQAAPQTSPLPVAVQAELPAASPPRLDTSTASFSEPSRPAPSQAAPAPAEPSFVAAVFDAAYLNNPKPEYPNDSRMLGEAGAVLLRVRVSAQGQAEAVELARPSGFARLDRAARNAVRSWRFVPARLGDQPVASTVLIPINFDLNRS